MLDRFQAQEYSLVLYYIIPDTKGSTHGLYGSPVSFDLTA